LKRGWRGRDRWGKKGDERARREGKGGKDVCEKMD